MGFLSNLLNFSSKPVRHEESISTQKVSELTISVDTANVEVIIHDSTRVDILFESYEGGPGLEISHTEHALTIISKKEVMGPVFTFGNLPKCILKLHVPADIADHWDIKATSGVIKAADLITDSLRVHATSGKVTLNNIKSEKMAVNTTSGTIALNELGTKKLRFSANSGKVEINASYGDVIGQVGSGGMLLTGLKGEILEAQAGSGKVVLKEVYMKDVTIQANSGKVEAENLWAERTNAKVGSGKINIRDFRGEVKGNANSGNINISVTENTALDLKTGSGNINLEFHEFELNSTFDIHTGSGDIITNVPMQVEKHSKHHLRAVAGTGESAIHLQTGSGRAVLYTAKSSLIKKGKGNKM